MRVHGLRGGGGGGEGGGGGGGCVVAPLGAVELDTK